MPPKFKKPAIQPPTSSGPVVIYWFRTDLRLHDSPALTHALSLNPSRLYPIWTWDPHYVYTARVGPNRWNFLLSCMRDVSSSITTLNPAQKLFVLREAPQTVLRRLFKLWNVDVLVFERDTDGYARMRDQEVEKIAQECGVKVVSVTGRTLWDVDELVRRNGGKPTMSMAQVLKASAGMEVARPLGALAGLPDPGEMSVEELESGRVRPEADVDFNKAIRGLGEGSGYQFSIAGPKRDFGVPELEELGIKDEQVTTKHVGGETEALRLLKKYIDDEEYIGHFEKPKSAPTDFEPQSTTLLSPHHHFGSLSVRKYYWDVMDVFEKRKKSGKHVAKEPENLIGQIIFREMYFGAQAALGFAFAQTVNNPICRFIPWHLQSTYTGTPLGEHLLDGGYVVDDTEAEVYFRRWKEGRTGFPWIDALMRQLKYEGWIHHLGRHAVACFLTRGGCYVHWERGAEVFEEWLIDHETACNTGNWMWLACVAFFSQFYRCYSPITFPKKWDPEGNFVRKYVPELKEFDKKYIYEPHKAPIVDQKRWGCLIQGDGTQEEVDGMQAYPKPMFDFNQRRQFCIDKMKEAYDKHMMGNDKRVLDGSWKKVFDYPEGEMEKKDEELGVVENGKRKRETGPDADDIGEAPDTGDATGDEPLKKSSRRSRNTDKSADKSPSKPVQATLEVMVRRARRK